MYTKVFHLLTKDSDSAVQFGRQIGVAEFLQRKCSIVKSIALSSSRSNSDNPAVVAVRHAPDISISSALEQPPTVSKRETIVK